MPVSLMQLAVYKKEIVLQPVLGQTGAGQAGREQQKHTRAVCWKALQNLLTSVLTKAAEHTPASRHRQHTYLLREELYRLYDTHSIPPVCLITCRNIIT